MAKQEKKLTIFLSYSNKDVEKVRKIRDILETLNCNPVMFYLACMDEKNAELTKLIEDEIAARDVFVYCRSKNAEKSNWVAKELAYIRQKNEEEMEKPESERKIKRQYIIDLDEKFEVSVVTLLKELMNIIYKNTVVLCQTSEVAGITKDLRAGLIERGFNVIDFDPTKKSDQPERVLSFCRNGIFVPVLYKTECNDDWDFYMSERAFYIAKEQGDVLCLPVWINATREHTYPNLQCSGYILPAQEFAARIPTIVNHIAQLADDQYDAAQVD